MAECEEPKLETCDVTTSKGGHDSIETNEGSDEVE